MNANMSFQNYGRDCRKGSHQKPIALETDTRKTKSHRVEWIKGINQVFCLVAVQIYINKELIDYYIPIFHKT